MTLTSLHLVKCYISGKHVNYGALSQADFITCRQNQVRSSPFLFFILNFFETFEGFKSSHLQESKCQTVKYHMFLSYLVSDVEL